MTDCEYAFRLDAFHDGELGEAQADEVRRHLEQCSACAAELARIRSLSAMLAGFAPEPSPSAMRRWRRTPGQLAAQGLRRLAAGLAAAAAAVLVACGVALWWTWPTASAKAAGAPPVWEASAVRAPGEPTSTASDDQLAMWIVQDLSAGDRP